GETLVAIDSGANINFDSLRHVAERAEVGEKREAIIAVTIPARPGSFKAFCEARGKRQIPEFNSRYNPNSDAHRFVGVPT
ncbi:threonine ammonia-lyase, biosynthetic, partial [Pseudomonas sp. BGr12]|nr:threonine ammonia-lyase, biosynthetic [Pseudomonas sp. BJa5]